MALRKDKNYNTLQTMVCDLCGRDADDGVCDGPHEHTDVILWMANRYNVEDSRKKHKRPDFIHYISELGTTRKDKHTNGA